MNDTFILPGIDEKCFTGDTSAVRRLFACRNSSWFPDQRNPHSDPRSILGHHQQNVMVNVLNILDIVCVVSADYRSIS